MARLGKKLLNGALQTKTGARLLDIGLKLTQYRVFSSRTVHMMRFDILRLRARIRHPQSMPKLATPHDRLHFGCGSRHVQGWLNVDVDGSECDVDLAGGSLPWRDSQFSCIAAQHVIEHLDLVTELCPLLVELRRVAKPGAEIWLTCPDLERVCKAYQENRGSGLIADRLTRAHGDLGMNGIPPQQMINNMFQQSGEHRNLLDFELLNWALKKAGFGQCERVDENKLLERFPEFPRRGDDEYSLYVNAVAM